MPICSNANKHRRKSFSATICISLFSSRRVLLNRSANKFRNGLLLRSSNLNRKNRDSQSFLKKPRKNNRQRTKLLFSLALQVRKKKETHVAAIEDCKQMLMQGPRSRKIHTFPERDIKNPPHHCIAPIFYSDSTILLRM